MIRHLLLFPLLAGVLSAVGIDAYASTAGAAGAKPSVRPGQVPRCVERRLDVRTGMMVTRYGCEKPRRGRWRDVGRAMGAGSAN